MTYGSSVLHRVLLNGVHLFIRAYYGVEMFTRAYYGVEESLGFTMYSLGAEVWRC